MALEREAFQSNESLFKLKLLDFTQKLLNLSAVEFDKICVGRIDRQTEEECYEISKNLFAAIRRAE